MGVNSTLYIGASGLRTFAEAMSIVSDNVANANTTGYKTNQARFGDMVSAYLPTQSTDVEREGTGSSILGVATNFGQGTFLNTGTWSDLAIDGEGYFNVQKLDSSGALSGTKYFSRDGSFHLNKDNLLVNNQGYAVLDSSGALITIPQDAANGFTDLHVTQEGEIWGTPIDPTAPKPTTPIATLAVSRFPNQGGLIREGSNLYRFAPEAGEEIPGTANAGGNGSISGGYVESSNVDLATEMVNMIIYQADYNANSKSVTTGNTMLDTVINMVR
jgi:flagellar hook protein FlgE